MARDLQNEFYEHFPEFLSAIIDLLHTKDVDQLEYTFTALAYLFKFLWRYLIRNVDKVFILLLPLLSDSRPHYINAFAAESFAFVVRKVKDKKVFLTLVLSALEQTQNGVLGCGKLLFEVISGISNQFHSSAEDLLPLYLESLQDVSLNQDLLYRVLTEIIKNILDTIHYQKCDVLWTSFFRVTHKFIENCSLFQKSQGREDPMILILRLMFNPVADKGGRMVKDPVTIAKKFAEFVNIFENNTEVLEEVLKLSTNLLLAPGINISQETGSYLVLRILSIPHTELLLTIVEKLIPFTSFESLVLPHLLKINIEPDFRSNVLRLLAKIIKEKAPPSLSGISLQNWRKFNLNVRSESIDGNFLLKNLNTLEDEPSEDALRVLLILPHLNPLDKDLKSYLLKSLVFLHEKIIETSDRQEINKLVFPFLLAVDSAVHILSPDDFYLFLTSNFNVLELTQKHKDQSAILNSLDLSLTYLNESQFRENIINNTTFDFLHGFLTEKLGSENPGIRLTVTHLFSLFKNVGGLKTEMENSGRDVFELLYLAENQPATVHKYRDKLLHLEALNFESQALICLDPSYYDVPIYYLIGNLYLNFSLLWDPVCKILGTYANKKCPQFWPIFLSQLTREIEVSSSYISTFNCDIMYSLEKRICGNDEKVDYENYRLLLWKSMAHFSEYCETKNRDLTVLFIDYVEKFIFKSNSQDGKSCSIEKRKEVNSEDFEEEEDEEMKEEETKENDEKEGENVDEDMKEDASKIKVDKKKKDNKEPRSRNKMKLLLAQMQVFSKVVNPKSLYREPEMFKIYLDLLTSKNSEVQKAALNCLFAYKHKYLLPYKEHLNNFVDEKHLKSELTHFKITKEDSVIEEDHRESLLPILMRIIYAKMTMRVGMRTGGKAGGILRRKMILRFLAGTEEEEMFTFVQMAFKPFQNRLPISSGGSVDLRQMVSDVISQVDLTNVTPPKRLQSAVNLLAILIEQFGGKMIEKLLPHLLRILICILAQVTGILNKSDEIHSGFLPSIRNVRTSCINILARFFVHFENYKWTTSEIDSVFDIAVFPWLEKLPLEGIHSPTALLKMFLAWSQNPRYYSLLVKHQENDETFTPLVYVMRLLLGPKTHPSVANTILEMIEKMLTLQDYDKLNQDPDAMEVDERIESLNSVVSNVLEINWVSLPKGINYGSAILLPHVTSILEYARKKLEKIKKFNKRVKKSELVILSRISEFVSDSKTSDTLLSLIVPILVKKASLGESEETIVDLLTTVTNLIKNVKNPEQHIRILTPLISCISGVLPRRDLIQLFNIIASRSSENIREKMIRDFNLLKALNSWDVKWVDQPDFQKRLDTFEELNSLIGKNEVSLEFGVAVIHNCFFFLKTEKDLAIRDSSGQCLKDIGQKLAENHKGNPVDRRYLIDDTILGMVRKSLRSKNETLKLQSIAFLGHMALECSEAHPVLRDLSQLANKVDPEVDFFENMQHLQLHRKVRALLKFCSVAKTLQRAPNPKTLTQFILPLASTYLCNEDFANKNSIVDASIETVGTVCQLLPWHQYEVILKYYLDKLRGSFEFQRQLVRLIVAILDAFHFDLSKYKEIKPSLEAEQTLILVESHVSILEETPIIDVENAENVDKLEAEINLDEALEKETDNHLPAEEVEEISAGKSSDLPAMERETVLSKYMAKRLVFSISKVLLPQLQRAIVARTHHENSHKVNRKKTGDEREEEELMRVPVALAVVKLLQKLPEGMLGSNLPGIFMKLCTFLKSKLESVRRATRDILKNIMITLGPVYLHHLLREMNTLLTKGFQVHVLVFTIQSVLDCLKPFLKPEHVNTNLRSILSVCKVDLFGLTAEEKEIIGIVKNTSEAKSTKSYAIFHTLAEFISESCLIDIMLPLKEVLGKTHSHKTLYKVGECLRRISMGLADNKFIETRQMLIFLYGVVSESIPDLVPTQKEIKASEKEIVARSRQNPDCFLIQPEPKSRMGAKTCAKKTRNTNAHYLVEFGLELKHTFLKRDKFAGVEYKPLLDPFVPILNDSLKSQHVKISTLALKCLNWVIKMDLPSVHELISEICSSIFSILHKYAVAGLSKGDNYDLVMAAFKCTSVILRNVKHFTISADQLKLLIIYAEQDLHDSERQATAFGLLRAIISRKMIVPEMYDVMHKVAILSVTSELDHVKLQSRQVFFSYLIDYPLGNKLKDHINFYTTQLNYELQPGRISVLEMIHSIVTAFPEKELVKYSGSLFVSVGVRLINDEDPACKKLCAKCIREMIRRLPNNQRNELFDVVMTWMKDKKITHRSLALQLCGIFILVETEGFESRLEEVLPFLLKQFHAHVDESKPGRFVKVPNLMGRSGEVGKNIKDPERLKDHHLILVLQVLLKVAANCTAFLKDEKFKDHVHSFAGKLLLV